MEFRTSHHKDFDHHSHQSSSSSPKNTVCVLSDHQPVNHQEIERLDIGEITEGITVNTVNRKEHCAQTIISELEDQRAQINSTESNTAVFEVKNEHCAQTIISELEDLRAQITSPESNTRWWSKQRYTQKVPTRNIWYISRKRMNFQTQDR